MLFTIIRRYVFWVMAPTQPTNEVTNNTLPITIRRSGYFDISSAAIFTFRLLLCAFEIIQFIFINANINSNIYA